MNQSTLDDLFLQFKTRYQQNTLLVTSVQKMLENYEENRPSFSELYEALPEYELIKNYFKENEVMLGLDEDNMYNFVTQGEHEPLYRSSFNKEIKNMDYDFHEQKEDESLLKMMNVAEQSN